MAEAPAAPPALRLLVVDDHPAVREGLALLVTSEGMTVVAEVSHRDDALRLVPGCHPDLAVVDLSLDGEDGVVLVGDLHQRGVPVLVYSMHHDPSHVERALAAGALGYVTKAEFRGVLVEAIRAVAAGRRFVSPRAAVALAEGIGAGPYDDLGGLSGQEREVYRLIGRGDSTQEIAAAMDLSVHTVESYCERVQHKLGVQGMHALRHHAVAHFQQPP